MSISSVPSIELQSFDLYRRVEHIHRHPQAAPENIRAKYILLYKVLEQACHELTAQASFAFANLFSRLDYVCRQRRMNPSDKYAIQTMRRNCHAAMGDRFQPVMEEYRYDLRALVRFISLAFGEDIPAGLVTEIPPSNRPYKGNPHTRLPYLRVSVSSWNDTEIFASTDSAEEPFIIINYVQGGYQEDLAYLKDLLQEHMQLNLLDVHIDENNRYLPRLVVVHPDYLIDISTLASCFREYGHHPLNYFMNKIKPRANTHHILLGNLASQFLDDYVNERPAEPVSYARTLKKFFSTAALDFCTCTLPQDFHRQAQAQMMNIRAVVQDKLPHGIAGFDRHHTLLEASFICEKLGIQGRVDMLQKDFSVLIEQKSGKRDEYNRRHKEDHYLQMMLYQGVLMYNFGQTADQLQSFLLYSKYPDGLLAEHFSESLFRECIRLRNLIVAQEMAFGEGDIARVTEELTTDLLNELQVHSRLWTDYQEPQLQAAIDTLKRCTPLEKAYFQRFFTFVSKELILSKTGGRTDASYGFAALWNLPLTEKLEAGNILTGLTVKEKRKSAPERGYDLLRLGIPRQEDDFLPNFRVGDIIVCYACQGQPDVRNHVLMKGTVVELTPEEITVRLRNGQQNKEIIGGGQDRFCIEHDASDLGATSCFKGLYAFLSARPERKALLLGTRQPTYDPTRTPNGSYGRFDGLIRKVKQSNDYFLLVGPPGTGKTSCALRHIVEEALTDADTSILLLSYTNRAVDEICQMLVQSGIAATHPFLRLGNETACDKRFVPYLLGNCLADCPKLEDIQRRIRSTRLFVGTATALNNRLNLFSLKHFALAIVDEASQLLEPDLTGILAAAHDQRSAIDKFILIGDYKQLPAIVQQSETEAGVADPLLRHIGLEDCRSSLFERLYRRSDDRFKSILHKQGRMHPALADFPNHAFYYHERLEPVPLPHQEEHTPYLNAPAPEDAIDRLLTSRRMVFIPAETPEEPCLSDKANTNEARIVALLLQHIHRLTADSFDAHTTVGVIVPYRNQIAMIRHAIAALDIPDLADISIDTVERYQGSQRDVIIYSFTIRHLSQLNFLTANTFKEGEFLIDRKLNVALTRARKQLLITGNPSVLGAGLTFYKLMAYIRQHNGYIAATCADFCNGRWEIPDYDRQWDLQPDIYPLGDAFRAAFDRRIQRPAGRTDDTLNRELTDYGRHDFLTGETAVCPPAERLQLYCFYYMRKQYCAAKALLETNGHWLLPTLRQTSGRVIFCDLSYECGASGLAFADVCRPFPTLELHYIGICPTAEMEQLTQDFWQDEAYHTVTCHCYAHLNQIPDRFWTSHAHLTDLVLFNVSNRFDRTDPSSARQLAADINRLVRHLPHHRYAVLFRDDSGPLCHLHSYEAFCHHLDPMLQPLHPQMPRQEVFYYRKPTPTKAPDTEPFVYEIRCNHHTGI